MAHLMKVYREDQDISTVFLSDLVSGQSMTDFNQATLSIGNRIRVYGHPNLKRRRHTRRSYFSL